MTTTQRNRPGDTEAAYESFGGDVSTIPQDEGMTDLDALLGTRARLGQFAARMIEDALLAALPATWERRAQALEDARHGPQDAPGRADADELARRARELDEAAQGCRDRAELLRRYPDFAPVDLAVVVGLALDEQGVAA